MEKRRNPLAAAFLGAAAHILRLHGVRQHAKKTRHSGKGEDRRADKEECPNSLLRRYRRRYG